MTTISLDLDSITAWDGLHYLIVTGRDLSVDVAVIAEKRAQLVGLLPIEQAIVAWLMGRVENPDLPFAVVAQRVPLFAPPDEDEPEPEPEPA